MRFLSFLAITAIAFCMAMCTPNPANNVTPAAAGNCRDGIQNGDEQGVDCGSTGCAYTCNGNMTITAATITYSSGQVTSSSSAGGTCYTTNPPTVGNTATRSSTTMTTYFSKNGTLSSYMGMTILYSGTPTIGSYGYGVGSSYCLGGVVKQFSISGVGYPTQCIPVSGTGTLNITNVNTVTRKMSGNFSATLQCTGNYPVSGTFTDVSY